MRIVRVVWKVAHSLKEVWHDELKDYCKLPKLLKDTVPMFEIILGIIGMVLGAPILGVCLGFFVGLIVWLTSLLLIAHAFYRMEMEGDC